MILLTGGTGFLGSYLCRYLLKEGYKVRMLVRSDSKLDLVRDIKGQVELCEGDVLDIYSLIKAMQDIEVVYHCAALVSFKKSEHHRMMKVNVEGTANMVNVALDSGVKRILHTSSIAALGRRSNGEDIDEDIEWEASKLNTMYAISKYMAEREVWRGFAEGLDGIIVNPSMIIGAGDWNNGTARLFKKIKDGLTFYTGGSTGYIDVRDVAKLSVALMKSELNHQRFILSAENLRLEEFIKITSDKLGKSPPKIRAGSFLLSLAWRFENIKSMLLGSDPLITREAAILANNRSSYKNDKVKSAMNWNFISINKTIEETCEILKSRGNNETEPVLLPTV